MNLNALLHELKSHFGFSEGWLQKFSGLSASEQKAALDTHLKNEGREAEFYQVLREWIKTEQQKNVIEGGEYKVQGKAHIGDTNPTGEEVGQKNILKDTKMEVGGDFRLGDVSGSSAPSSSKTTKKPSQVAVLVAQDKVEEALQRGLENVDPDTQEQLLLLSAQLTLAQREYGLSILTFEEYQRARTKVGREVLRALSSPG